MTEPKPGTQYKTDHLKRMGENIVGFYRKSDDSLWTCAFSAAQVVGRARHSQRRLSWPGVHFSVRVHIAPHRGRKKSFGNSDYSAIPSPLFQNQES